jgi:hypothetical protein
MPEGFDGIFQLHVLARVIQLALHCIQTVCEVHNQRLSYFGIVERQVSSELPGDALSHVF